MCTRDLAGSAQGGSGWSPPAASMAWQTLARAPWEGEAQQGAGHEAAAGAPVRAGSTEQ